MEPGSAAVPRRHTAVAILRVGERFALQHRDDKPGIAAPGLWGLFGGEALPGEPPSTAIRREIEEELGRDVTDFAVLWTVDHHDGPSRHDVRFTVFTADVSEHWPRHRLTEGQGTGLFTVDELPERTATIARALIERYVAERRRKK